jgi:hypothetical protein
MAMIQFLGLGLSYIEALLGFLGLKGGIGNKGSWYTVEDTLGDGEEFLTKEVMAANLAEEMNATTLLSTNGKRRCVPLDMTWVGSSEYLTG